MFRFCLALLVLFLALPAEAHHPTRRHGNRPHYIVPKPRSYVYYRYQYPPHGRVTAATRDAVNAIREKGGGTDWKAYQEAKPCPYCHQTHKGGNCVPPIGTEKKQK